VARASATPVPTPTPKIKSPAFLAIVALLYAYCPGRTPVTETSGKLARPSVRSKIMFGAVDLPALKRLWAAAIASPIFVSPSCWTV